VLPRELWRVFNSDWPKLYYARNLRGTRALLRYANSLHVTRRKKSTLRRKERRVKLTRSLT